MPMNTRKPMTNQIVQVRHENGEWVEDAYPVLYEIAGQAFDAFHRKGPEMMFEHGNDPEADYFVRELDTDYIETGKQWHLVVLPVRHSGVC